MLCLKKLLSLLQLKKNKRILNKLQNLPIEELILIIEKRKYHIEVQKASKKTLNKHKKSEVTQKTVEYWKNYIENNIKSIIISQTYPTSFLLSEQQIKRLIKIARNKKLKNTEGSGNATPTGWDVGF